MEIYDDIKLHVAQALSDLDWAANHSLIVYGSAANGLATSGNSDLDLSLIVHDIHDPTREKFQGQSFLGIKKIEMLLMTIKEYLED